MTGAAFVSTPTVADHATRPNPTTTISTSAPDSEPQALACGASTTDATGSAPARANTVHGLASSALVVHSVDALPSTHAAHSMVLLRCTTLDALHAPPSARFTALLTLKAETSPITNEAVAYAPPDGLETRTLYEGSESVWSPSAVMGPSMVPHATLGADGQS